jgi:hypothetical protein
MIIGMRTYKITPGTRSRFLEIFHSKSIPAPDKSEDSQHLIDW